MLGQHSVSLLRTLLARLYESEADARRLVSDVGLDAGHITFVGSAINRWQSILSEADKHAKVSELVKVAAIEYPAQAEILWRGYMESTNRSLPVETGVSPPTTVASAPQDAQIESDGWEQFSLTALVACAPELTQALTERSLVIFLGADLPQSLTGIPARTDLARGLAQRYQVDDTLSLAEVAQRVSRAGNRFAFTSYLRNQLDGIYTPQPFHLALAQLIQSAQVATIFSTAYDRLLEIALQQRGVALNRVVNNDDIPLMLPRRPTLYKLYGDLQQPESLVVTDQDHSNLLRDRERDALLYEMAAALRRNTTLFIGHNLSDPDFRFLFDQIAGSRFARTAYAYWPTMDEATRRMWNDRGIVVLG